jgi:hypothetical protein
MSQLSPLVIYFLSPGTFYSVYIGARWEKAREPLGVAALGDPLDAAAASHRPGACKKSTHGRLFTRAISIPVTCVGG